MTVDESLKAHWSDAQKMSASLPTKLASRGGDGHPPGMETEVALLKQRADQTDQRLERMEGKLDQIVEGLRHVATKDDVREAKNASWQALGIGSATALAVLAIILAILTYLQDQRIATRPEAPQLPPIILNMPATQPPSAQPPATPRAP